MSDIDGSSFRSAPGYKPAPVRKSLDEKLRDASKMYEKLFLREMMKSMRSTVSESGFIKQNAAEKLFREEMDAETVNKWSDNQGLGLADMIYENLIEKFGARMGLRERVQAKQGPLELNARANYTGPRRVPATKPNEVAYRFDRTGGADPAADSNKTAAGLVAPWNGTVTESRDLGEGLHLLGLSHDDGLSGRFVFKGTPDRLVSGQSVQGGERIGLLSPESKSFFWTLALETAPDAGSAAPEAAPGAADRGTTVSE